MPSEIPSAPLPGAPPARPDRPLIAIVGGGSIGLGFAVVFARAGYPVRLFEPAESRRAVLPAELAARLAGLDSAGLLPEPPAVVRARVSVEETLAAALEDTAYVQECAPEDLALKRALFAELDRTAPPEAVLASASSALTASAFAADLAGRSRVLVVHPGNPPFLIALAEIVPAPFTDPAVVERACDIVAGAGLAPIRVGREIEGFVFNRLQGALLREAYCLVRDGVASVSDVDRVVRDGLGLRWSVIGPFETADLNTRGGIAAHAKKMGPAYARMGAERGQHDPWTDDLVARVTAERRAELPLERWEEGVARRDARLMALVRQRRAGDVA